MSYLDKYLSMNKTYGEDLRTSQISSMQSKIQESFYNSPSYYQVSRYAPSSPSKSTTIDTWVLDHSEQRDYKEVQVYPSQTLNYGDIITWQGDNWLVLQVDNIGDVYNRGYMQKCLSSIKWLDDNGLVKEASFTTASQVQRGLGLTETKTIMLLSTERRYIIVQNNADTQKIEKGNRFIFDTRGWRVTSIDRLNTGLIHFELEEYDIDTANDNVDLRIADYVKNTNYTLEIANGGTLKVQVGSTYQLNVEVKLNGVILNKPVTFSSSYPSTASVSSTGLVTAIADGSITITASLVDNPEIKDTTNIIVQSISEPNYSVSILGDDAMYCNQTKIYTEQIKDNDVVVVGDSVTVEWFLYDDSGLNPTTLATMVTHTSTECTLVANNNNQRGFVKLKAIVNGSSSVTYTKRIEIKTLI